MKLGLVTSKGGHLFQVYQLKEWWEKYDHFWITFPGEDVASMLGDEKVYYGYYPESRNLINAFRNIFVGIKVLLKEKPDLLFSAGAGICPPVFLVGKLFECKLIYMEPYDFIDRPTLTGRIVYRMVDHFIVQHKEQIKFYPKAIYRGAVI